MTQPTIEPWMREAALVIEEMLLDCEALRSHPDAYPQERVAAIIAEAYARATAGHEQRERELREAFNHFVCCALTCEKSNNQEWMEYFRDEINKAAKALGDDDRCELYRTGFRIIRGTVLQSTAEGR